MNNADEYNRRYLAGRAMAKLKGIEINPRWPTWDQSLHLECLKCALDGNWHFELVTDVLDVLQEGFKSGSEMADIAKELHELVDRGMDEGQAEAFVNGVLDETMCIKRHIDGLPA